MQYVLYSKWRNTMAGASKNSRTSVTTHKFICNCGGEIIMKTMFEKGKIKVDFLYKGRIYFGERTKI